MKKMQRQKMMSIRGVTFSETASSSPMLAPATVSSLWHGTRQAQTGFPASSARGRRWWCRRWLHRGRRLLDREVRPPRAHLLERRLEPALAAALEEARHGVEHERQDAYEDRARHEQVRGRVEERAAL